MPFSENDGFRIVQAEFFQSKVKHANSYSTRSKLLTTSHWPEHVRNDDLSQLLLIRAGGFILVWLQRTCHSSHGNLIRAIQIGLLASSSSIWPLLPKSEPEPPKEKNVCSDPVTRLGGLASPLEERFQNDDGLYRLRRSP